MRKSKKIEFERSTQSSFPWYIEESKYKEYKLKPIDFQNYTTIVDEKENIRRNSLFSDELVSKLIDDIDTLPKIMINSTKRFPNNPCLGTRYPSGEKKTIKDPSDPNKNKEIDVLYYKWETYSEVWDMAKFFGKGLLQIGYKPKDFVGIYSKNRREWLISLYGTYSQSMVNVAIYDTFGPEVLRYCCEDAKIGIIIAEKSNLEKILTALEKQKIDVLKTIIVIGEIDQDIKLKFSKFNIEVCTFESIIELGKKNDDQIEMNLPKPDDLATVMYTSGSTGDPKGVMLNHSNVIATISSVLLTLEIPGSGPIGTNDTYISYLTLAHILERVCCDAMLFVGAKIGFSSGKKEMLIDDLLDLKPTLMAVVPKVLSGIKEKIEQTLNNESKIKQMIFQKGYEKQSEAVNHGDRKMIWDVLVFNRIKKELGGQIRLMISGGAPLTEELWEFAKVSFGAPVLQGWSLTETAAAGTITNANDLQLTAGILVPSIEIKLKDCEEAGETKEGIKTGEIWIRGPSVFVGYYNKEEKTKEDLDSDGWFHTGDIGYFTKNGSLKIVDRKKNIFKLANGEYIAAEKIENVFSSSELVSQVFIHGESDKDYLIAIVVPNKNKTSQTSENSNEKSTESKETSSNESNSLENEILEDFQRISKSSNLKGPEIPKKVIISDEPWNEKNGLATATMKIKREALKKKFKDQIEKAYQEKETPKSK